MSCSLRIFDTPVQISYWIVRNMAQMRSPKFIDGFGKSHAMLSSATGVDTAVNLVHGFGGKPTSTWRDFHGLVDEYSPSYTWWATSDMFFYAYESLHTPIRRNADLLGDFVELVWGGTWQTNGSCPGSKKYKDLILVGHSEGGVIIRRLILNRYERHKVAVETSNPTANADHKNGPTEDRIRLRLPDGSLFETVRTGLHGNQFFLMDRLSHFVFSFCFSGHIDFAGQK
jgi:hypothetical protein